MLNTKDPDAIENLLDLEIYDKIEFDNTLSEKSIVILAHFLAALFSFAACLIPYFLLSDFGDSDLVKNILRCCFYAGLICSSYLFAESFIRSTRKYILKVFLQTKFPSFLFKKRYVKLRVIFTTIFFTSLIIIVNNKMPIKNVNEQYSEFQKNFFNIAIGISTAMICLLISGTTVDYLDFYSYQMNYRSRVKYNKEVFEFILKLNEFYPEEIKNLKKYAKNLFKKLIIARNEKGSYTEIKPEANYESDTISDSDEENNESNKIKRRNKKSKGNILTKSDFKKLVDAPEMFSLFDFDRNNQVTKYEFVKRYITIFNERDSLRKALEHNSANMLKINVLISSLFIPFIVFILLALTGQIPKLSDSFTIAGLVVFPFTFAFKSVIEEIFTSVIFVFFVKPFDYGDIFLIDSDRYEVLNIGILYSDFRLNQKFITLKNTFFNSARIFNLRKSEFLTNLYTFKFDYKSYKQNEEKFTNKLDEYFQKTPSSSYRLGNYKIAQNTITIDVESKIVIPYQEIDTIDERNDSLTLFINDLITQIGIQQV